MRIRFDKVFWGLIAGLFAACLIVMATPGAGYLFNNFTRSTAATNWLRVLTTLKAINHDRMAAPMSIQM